jgi:Uncharacterized conserved protein
VSGKGAVKAGLDDEEFMMLLKGWPIMKYTILIHQAEEGGFWSEVPALPGCYSQGETIDETLLNTKEAIEAHLIALKEDQVTALEKNATTIRLAKMNMLLRNNPTAIIRDDT